MSENDSVKSARSVKRWDSSGGFGRGFGDTRQDSDLSRGTPSGRRAWWCFWGALALASAVLESQPGLLGSGRPADPMVQIAYLDPGAGSFIIQALVAALAGIAVTLKVYWHRIMEFFGRATPSEDDDDETLDYRSDD